MHYANNKETIELLLAKGADINAKNDTGMTALHYASINGRKEFAKLLIEKGADLFVENSKKKLAQIFYQVA